MLVIGNTGLIAEDTGKRVYVQRIAIIEIEATGHAAVGADHGKAAPLLIIWGTSKISQVVQDSRNRLCVPQLFLS